MYRVTSVPTNHTHALMYFRGVCTGVVLPCRGTNAGSPGLGGGEAIRRLKLNREEVDDSGPLSLAL